MKLLFIASSRIPTERAMGTAIMKQCEAFARSGIEVELFVPRRVNTHTEDPYEYHDVERLFRIRYIWSLDLAFLNKSPIRFFIQKLTFFLLLNFALVGNSADVVYGREPEIIAPLITRKRKFVELHHLYGLGYLGKFFLNLCDGVMTITHALKEDVSKSFSYSKERMLVVPSGIDLEQFRVSYSKDTARTSLGITTDLPVALYIGALEGWKGHITFLEASRFLQGKVTCAIVGGTSSQIEILKESYPHVVFCGFSPQKKLPLNQHAADVLVVPNSGKEIISSRHTSPLKLLAHMASGIPIVASRLDSIREIVSETSCVLVPPDDAEALSRGILEILNDPERSAIMAQTALDRVQQYDWRSRTASIVRFIYETA